MTAITSECWLVEMWQMWKCENVKMWQMIINGYEFWKSFCVAMYMSGGARLCSVQSPPTVYAGHCQYLSAVAVNICRLLLSISVCCRCQYLSAVAVKIWHCYYCAVAVAVAVAVVQSWQSWQSCRSYWMLTFKNLKVFHMSCVFYVEQIKSISCNYFTCSTWNKL